MLRDRDDSVPRSTSVLVPVKRYRRHVGAHLEQVALAVIVTSQQDAEIEENTPGDDAGLPKRPDDGSSNHWEDVISEASSKSESPERFSRMEAAQPAHIHEVCENVILLSLQYTLLNIVLMFLQPSLRSERSNVREEVENPLRVSARVGLTLRRLPEQAACAAETGGRSICTKSTTSSRLASVPRARTQLSARLCGSRRR